ncbi:MCE family protein [Thermomonospora amylolytica]|uniref:MCE family protein n=1 Tax=Thermomonospora amylolytica TaxID=1411117 RepID=UPI000E6D5016|nr:MCE family protein [Thermomonospora amylolytica]
MRRLTALATGLALVAATGGCSVAGGDGAYRVTVYFAKTTSLYEQSRVKVMGADAGVVTGITAERGRVRVDLEMNEEVPLPANVHAAIVSANTLGERYVQLHPAWRRGQPKAGPGTVIPVERTELPVEVDEALDAFGRLGDSLDARTIGDAVESGADGLRGKGDDVNRGLQAAATLTGDLAAQDRRLVRVAERLRSLATTLNERDERLTGLIDSFSATSRALAEERQRLQAFVSGLAAVIQRGEVLITAYRETLPGTVADMSNIVMTLKANAGALNQTIAALGRFADVAVQAWDRERNTATVRIIVHGTVRAWLQPLFTAMGWGTVPCIEDEPQLGRCTEGAR